jgi:hypothetical protein
VLVSGDRDKPPTPSGHRLVRQDDEARATRRTRLAERLDRAVGEAEAANRNAGRDLYIAARHLSDGRFLAVSRQPRVALLVLGTTWDRGWLYRTAEAAILALVSDWDGQGVPPGPFIRRVRFSGRLPGSEPTTPEQGT